jgi:ABC-type multidrug transport system fused ATPase/permease subunit
MMGETVKSGLDLKYLENVYNDSDLEQDLYSPRAPENWPSEGKIEVQNINVSYSNKSKNVIKNLSFFVEPRTKIGIIGRTGSGKSTLLSAITRIVELN